MTDALRTRLGRVGVWTNVPAIAEPSVAREVVVRGASHDDPAELLSLTRRRSYDRRGASAGHHHVGFRCATSEDLGRY